MVAVKGVDLLGVVGGTFISIERYLRFGGERFWVDWHPNRDQGRTRLIVSIRPSRQGRVGQAVVPGMRLEWRQVPGR